MNKAIIIGASPMSFSAAPRFSMRANIISITSPQVKLTPRDLRRIKQAIDYIESHYPMPISQESLSLEVGLSVTKLQTGLRQETGYSLYKYHEQVRIRHARSYLEGTDMRLAVLASTVGFKTQSHFGEVFKRITGLTPSQYRNRYGC